MTTFEIYLAKKEISKEEWLTFIKVISNYVGYFKTWKIIVTNDQNQIRYYVKTKCTLPPTINNLDMFILKQVDNVELPRKSYSLLSFLKIGENIIDIINRSEIKKKGTLSHVKISIKKVDHEKFLSKTVFYLRKENIIKKYHVLFALPHNLLAVDFQGNKRYFYKKAPKYLDIGKVLHLLKTDSNSALLKIDTFPYLQGDFYLHQHSYNFDKHSMIVGSSGCGKSKFISMMITNIKNNMDLKQKYKIVVIDPHAALEDEFGGISKVVDFKTIQNSIDLFINNKEDVISATEILLELLKSLISDQYNSKLERVLRHTIYLLLVDESFNFQNLRKVILDLEYRNDMIKKQKYNLPVSIIDFFLADFNDLKTKSYGEAISPIIAFIDEMEMVPAFNEQNQTNLKETIQNNFVTLFSLDRMKLGDKITKTISGLVMQQLLNLIQKQEIEEHTIFIIDEVAVVENPILARFLSEARKYNLSLILIGQYFNQITENLKNAIFANVINYYIFRVSKLDANILADNFSMKIPLEDTREAKIKLLTELNNRECVVRINTNNLILPAFKATTLDFQKIPRIKEIEINEKKEEQVNTKKISKFEIKSNIPLKDILLTSSSSRKVVK